MRRFVVLFTLLTTALVLSASQVDAQYPTPVGSLTASVDAVGAAAPGTTNPNPTVGSNALLTCELRDRAGSPVAGAPCTISIAFEPGSDAEVGSKSVTRTTDANGRASTILRTGSTPGVIGIRMESTGLASNVLVNVRPATSAPLPPAAPISVTPPSTGDGGLAAGR